MNLRARIAGYHRLRDQPLWRLLAADHAPELVGLLQALLLDGERRLPASILHERLQHQLDAINASNLPRALARTAQAYVADWLSQGAFVKFLLPARGWPGLAEVSSYVYAQADWYDRPDRRNLP